MLTEPKCTEPYYTTDALPTKLPQVYRAILHQTSKAY